MSANPIWLGHHPIEAKNESVHRTCVWTCEREGREWYMLRTWRSRSAVSGRQSTDVCPLPGNVRDNLIDYA